MPLTVSSTSNDDRFDEPFADLTMRLFRGVRDHDLASLEALCDDDFGIVDIAPDGGSVVIRDREGWRAWFENLFSQLTAMDAATDTEIHDYRGTAWGDAGMSVVDFVQTLTVGGLTGRFTCQATIVWKQQEGDWREARWHCSLLATELPDGFGVAPEPATAAG